MAGKVRNAEGASGLLERASSGVVEQAHTWTLALYSRTPKETSHHRPAHSFVRVPS